MPSSIDYTKIEGAVSSSRISTYNKFFPNHTDQEIFGVYLWNKAVCSALFPLLQATEISLRNAISGAAKERFGDEWHKKIKHLPKTKKNGEVGADNYKKITDGFRTSYKSVKRHLNPSQTVDFNAVVAETNFAIWEYLLHPTLFHPADKDYLWPRSMKKAFKNWPDKKNQKKSLDAIHRLVVEVRSLRNRLSHHEPLWKAASVKNEDDALIYLSKKIDSIENLLTIISPEKVKYLNLQNLFIKARSIARKESLDVYRYRSKTTQLSVKKKRRIRAFLIACHDQDCGRSFSYADRKFLLIPV